jgi:hypothetical protein
MILIIIEEVINALLNEVSGECCNTIRYGVTTGVGNLGAPVISLGTTTEIEWNNQVIK